LRRTPRFITRPEGVDWENTLAAGDPKAGTAGLAGAAAASPNWNSPAPPLAAEAAAWPKLKLGAGAGDPNPADALCPKLNVAAAVFFSAGWPNANAFGGSILLLLLFTDAPPKTGTALPPLVVGFPNVNEELVLAVPNTLVPLLGATATPLLRWDLLSDISPLFFENSLVIGFSVISVLLAPPKLKAAGVEESLLLLLLAEVEDSEGFKLPNANGEAALFSLD